MEPIVFKVSIKNSKILDHLVSDNQTSSMDGNMRSG